jgi:N-formylglutamate deformylase
MDGTKINCVRVPGVLSYRDALSPAAPVVIDSPHSGTEYPDDFGFVVSHEMLRRAEDMYVDELFESAPTHGAKIIVALFPRSYIDPNRALEDLDPAMMADPWPGMTRSGDKVRQGFGLIWRLCPPDSQMYQEKLTSDAVLRRIDGYWKPYHRHLSGALDEVHRSFDAVWHLNCHSMPSRFLAGAFNGVSQPDFVLGDRDGTTCERAFTALVHDTLRELGYRVRINDPYKGVEIVRAYSNPSAGRHSLQLEINRAIYMNEETFERHENFDALKGDIDRLLRKVCAYATSQTR